MKALLIGLCLALVATVANAQPGVRTVEACGVVTTAPGTFQSAGFGVRTADYSIYVQQGRWGRTLSWTWPGGGWDSVGGVPATGSLVLQFTGSEVEFWYDGLLYDSRPSPPSGGGYCGWWLQQAGGGTAALLDWREIAMSSWGTSWDSPADLTHFSVSGGSVAVAGGQLAPSSSPCNATGWFGG